MAECAFCGGAMRPGATFCGACGETLPAGGGSAPGAGTAHGREADANARAGVALASMPLILVLGVVAFSFATGDGAPPVVFLIFGAGTAVVLALAYAVWRGHAWARWVALAATLAWGAFMVWSIPSQIGLLRDPYMGVHPQVRRSVLFGLGIGGVEVVLAAATLYFLIFRGKADQ